MENTIIENTVINTKIPIIKSKIKAKEVDYTNTCSICNCDYNDKLRKKVVCYCNIELCRICIKSYILSKNEIPHCFNCNIEWSRTFLIKNITVSWFNKEYTSHHNKYLLEIEKSKFADTIIYIEKKQRNKIESQIITDKIVFLRTNFDIVQKDFHNEINTLKRQMDNIYLNKTIEKKEFISKCPNNYCIGYLSSSHKCDLCNNWFCVDCNELKGKTKNDEHICNPDIVENVKALNKECKKCPNCNVLIFMISGCDMMWCVSCHTTFSWKTLKILSNQNIHNPHYFEWLRTQTNITENIERNPNDILCGREIDNIFVFNFLKKIKIVFKLNKIISYYKDYNNKAETVFEYNKLDSTKQKNNDIYITFAAILQSMIHIRMVDIQEKYNNNFVRFDIDNNNNIDNASRLLRMSFMENEISETKFLSQLQRRDKLFNKNNDFTTLLRMYVSCMTDILYRIYDDISFENVDNYFNEITGLKNYVDEELKQISINYGCIYYNINYKVNWLLKTVDVYKTTDIVIVNNINILPNTNN